MPQCELVESCIFFTERMHSMPGTTQVMKKTFCMGNKTSCSRYIVFQALGREKVPDNLYPNHLEQARRLISKEIE